MPRQSVNAHTINFTNKLFAHKIVHTNLSFSTSIHLFFEQRDMCYTKLFIINPELTIRYLVEMRTILK